MDFLNRQRPLLQEEGIAALSNAYIAQAGLGGVGGVAFQTLVRAGVRRFRLAENGVFDPPDMNRQPGASAATMGKPKLDYYVEWARSINPQVELELYPQGVSVDNIEDFLQGTDVHIGVIDLEKGRDVKEKGAVLCRRMGIPIFTSGAIGFGTLVINYHPEGMGQEEFWNKAMAQDKAGGLLPEAMLEKFHPEIINRVQQGLGQGILSTVSVGANMAGTVLANEVMTYLLQPLGWLGRDAVFAPQYMLIDLAKPVLSVETVE